MKLPCKPRSSKWVLSFGCPHQSPVFLFHVRATCPAELILLDLSSTNRDFSPSGSVRFLQVTCYVEIARAVQCCTCAAQQSALPANYATRSARFQTAGLPVPFSTNRTCWFLPNNTQFYYQLGKWHVPGCDHPGSRVSHCLRNLGWMKLRALPSDQVFCP
jgi:hypothetical protein